MKKKPLEQAVRIAGSQIALAKGLGVTRQAIQQWLKSGRPPATRVLAIEKLTGVNRSKLRPDIYPMMYRITYRKR